MLTQLYIKNIALIEEVFIEFGPGLNILSGETGAGKSIIIDSINFVLGGRFGKDFINKNFDNANVDAMIYVKDEMVKNHILNMGIDIDEDNFILISRSISRSGKSSTRINGKPVTVSMLKEITEKLVDIHGQHQHQSLLNSSKHILLLDRFCENELEPLKLQVKNKILKYKSIIKSLSQLDLDFNKRDERIDILKYQLDELEQANLKENEEEALIQKRNIIMSSENLKNLYVDTLDKLYNFEEHNVIDQISLCLDNLLDISNIDNTKKDIYEQLNEIYINLQDITSRISKANDLIEYKEQELDFIENRLDLIYNLKKKYGPTIREIIQSKNKIQDRLDFLVNSEEKIIELLKQKEVIEKNIKLICLKISEIRKKFASQLENKIEEHLLDLGMKNVKFKVDIKMKSKFTQNGFDNVEFLISPNVGEDLKPLSKIASGGEMSRVMLSLKAVLSSVDTIDTFIFDEIDTGVSGRTAQQVAEKLAFLAKDNQILCITHLPQIASMADSHFLIQKEYLDNKTVTYINKLTYEDEIKEISRMTAGAEITEKTLNAAKEMKQQASKIKYSI